MVAFLEGLFEVADPYVGTEREVTARQIRGLRLARNRDDFVHVAQADFICQSQLDFGNIVRHFACDEFQPTARAFVIEEDAGTGK